MLDLADIADVIADAVKEATAPLMERIDALERRELPAPIAPDEEAIAERVLKAMPEPKKGDPGEVDMEAVRELIGSAAKEQVAALAATLPLPEKGDPGVGIVSAEVRHNILEITLSDGTLIEAGDVGPRHGKDADPEMVKAVVADAVAEAVKALPAPEPVEPLAPDMDAIAKLIQDGIAKAVSELPPAAKGEPGIGLTGAMIDREGDLVLTLSNGETRNVGRVVGKDGESPPPFTLDDFDIVPTNERTIEMSFTQGDVKHTFELAFPVLIGRGIWNAEEDYQRGDVTTWGGTAWEAVEPEKGVKPDLSKGGWRILAKRGRDGKDAK